MQAGFRPLPHHQLPRAAPGQVVGLFGGSFDPAHEGHVQFTIEAMRRFGLDRVWWLVSPHNPLKRRAPAPLALRLAAARALMRHPRVEVTDLEARLGTRYTADSLAVIRRLWPGVRFVWLMGSDNLPAIRHWERWREIFETVPVGVLSRPGTLGRARLALLPDALWRARLPDHRARLLGRADPPAWAFLDMPLNPLSSTALRRAGLWPTGREGLAEGASRSLG